MIHFHNFIFTIVFWGNIVSLVLSQCFNLKNLPFTRGSILGQWSFYNVTPSTPFKCYKLCSGMPACKSMNFLEDNLLCNLNLKRASDVPNDVVMKNNVYYIDKGQLDQIFPSPCHNANCTWDEFCVGDKNGHARCIQNRKCEYSATSLVLRKMSGFIQSVNYPASYPVHSRQEFTIIGPIGHYVELKFIAFHTEDSYDFLTIREGCNGLSPFLYSFSGPTNPGVVKTTHNYVWIHFSSDYSHQYSGFKIEYTMRLIK